MCASQARKVTGWLPSVQATAQPSFKCESEYVTKELSVYTHNDEFRVSVHDQDTLAAFTKVKVDSKETRESHVSVAIPSGRYFLVRVEPTAVNQTFQLTHFKINGQVVKVQGNLLKPRDQALMIKELESPTMTDVPRNRLLFMVPTAADGKFKFKPQTFPDIKTVTIGLKMIKYHRSTGTVIRSSSMHQNGADVASVFDDGDPDIEALAMRQMEEDIKAAAQRSKQGERKVH